MKKATRKGPKPRSAKERFWPKVAKAEGCWLWQAALDRRGYGVFWEGTRVRAAHQMAYELTIGPIPEGLELDHLCRTPACVNPAHLEPVTHQENVARWNATRTHCKHGHEFTPSNTIIKSDGYRDCVTCYKARTRKKSSERSERRRLVRERKAAERASQN